MGRSASGCIPYCHGISRFLQPGLKINACKLAKINVRDFDKLQIGKISTSKRLRVRIIHVSQAFGMNLLVVSPVC